MKMGRISLLPKRVIRTLRAKIRRKKAAVANRQACSVLKMTSLFQALKVHHRVSENEINKQLNDKERVLAALENPNLLKMVNVGLKDSERDLEVYMRQLKISI